MMKKLLILLTLIVVATNVSSMAQPKPPDPQHQLRREAEAADRLGREVQRVPSNSEQDSRRERSAQAVADCPCGPDCQCPDEAVCKNGDCKRNYAIFFTAEWCGYCHEMLPTIEKLQKAGYIIYVYDVDDYPLLTKKYSVLSMPTTIFMDDGKEVHRITGAAAEFSVRDRLKTRQEQGDVYDL